MFFFHFEEFGVILRLLISLPVISGGDDGGCCNGDVCGVMLCGAGDY